ncbi:MAG TPA: patatin-like phospholipase family protein [Burkholderiales bacterium]|nr:patatin-like phospholipase family protein [Burkholderiales bacterium]
MFAGAQAKIAKPGPRKLLSLDGGGIRGLITIEILAKIESIVRERSGNRSLVLADYFDYIAGTSTGAVIGTLLALGKPVEEIRRIYLECGQMMFDKGAILKRLEENRRAPFIDELEKVADIFNVCRYYAKRWAGENEAYAKYPDAPLAAKLKDLVGGEAVTLDGDSLRSLLLVVLANATTDSPWPISNNPRAKYNDPDRPTSNAKFPLWQVVRASTAAPMFFPPQEISVGGRTFVFVDGGVTSYNNPSFQLFLEVTLEPYGLMWPAGEKNMLLVSVGTGLHPDIQQGLRRADVDAAAAVSIATEGLFDAAMYQQDLLCRVFGRCLAGDPLDREVGDLVAAKGPADPLRLFSYVRYNATLSAEGLAALGLAGIDPKAVQALDSVEHMPELQRVGKAVAERKVRPEHFAGFEA